MNIRYYIICFICLLFASNLYAQSDNFYGTNPDTLAAFDNADREADYQQFYGDAEDDEVMSKAIVRGGSSGLVNTRPTSNDNNEPCKIWAILLTDTKDKSIGEDDRLDNLALNKELKGIAQCLGMEISINNIVGNAAYRKRNLVNAIKEIHPAKNDIVFFCFNGHGFRWDNQKDKYPNICMMGPNDDVEGNYVLTTDIYNALVALKARLTICFTDCCNSKIGEYAPSQHDNTLYSRENTRVSKKRMRDLLLNTQGSILATAANPGEYAWSFGGSGSAFTQSFIAQLRKEVSANNTEPVSWERLMDNTIKSARKKTEDCENTQNGIRYIKVKGAK